MGCERANSDECNRTIHVDVSDYCGALIDAEHRTWAYKKPVISPRPKIRQGFLRLYKTVSQTRVLVTQFACNTQAFQVLPPTKTESGISEL